VDVVSVYRSNDLPVLESKVGTKFPILDLTQYGLAVPGMAVVASNEGIRQKGALLRNFLAATGKAIEMARADPKAATAAIKEVWQAGPSDEIVQQQIEATSISIPSSDSAPVGWIDEKAISGALKLISKVESIGDPKPASMFYTNELLPERQR
jgi:NitT/TauT family transport system substrate-binding protein